MSTEQEPTVSAIRSLTIAVWALVFVGIVSILARVGMAILPMMLSTRFSTFESEISYSRNAPRGRRDGVFRAFVR